MSRPSAWGWIRFCRCASDGPTLFCFHPPPASRQFSVLARYLSPRWSITGIRRRARDGQRRQPRRGLRASSAHAAGAAAARPYYLFGYSLGGTLAEGLPPACASAAKRWPSSACWIRPPETQNWAERGQRAGSRGTGGDRPRARSVPRRPAGQASGELFSAIEGNYADAVRLLTTAHARSLTARRRCSWRRRRGRRMDPQVVWGPWVGNWRCSARTAPTSISSPAGL